MSYLTLLNMKVFNSTKRHEIMAEVLFSKYSIVILFKIHLTTHEMIPNKTHDIRSESLPSETCHQNSLQAQIKRVTLGHKCKTYLYLGGAKCIVYTIVVINKCNFLNANQGCAFWLHN